MEKGTTKREKSGIKRHENQTTIDTRPAIGTPPSSLSLLLDDLYPTLR
jgi:hypothetical protein